MMNRILTWITENSYLTFCIVAVAFLLSLIIFGCDMPARVGTGTQAPAPVEVKKELVTVTNEMSTWYTVKITRVGDTWTSNIISYPGQVETIELTPGLYKVCLSREFSTEKVCVDKTVTEGVNEWKIRRR